MQGKGTVKNPLTVIAIFAGTAEISGTAVLPLLEATSQSIYIWFLMLFPFTLIGLFFITLNWNHKVLYAPSDFKDEDHFLNILQKATVKDKLEKINDETQEEGDSEEPPISNDAEEQVATSNQTLEPTNSSSTNSDEHPIKAALQLIESDSQVTDKETRELHRKLMGKIHLASRNDSEIAEKLVLEKLQGELGVKIETDMKFEFGRSHFVVDGVARKDNQLTAIEVRFMRDMKMGMGSMFIRTLDKFRDLYQGLSESQKREFSLIFAIVTDNVHERQLEMINRRVADLGFPAVVKVYDFDTLTSELLENAS